MKWAREKPCIMVHTCMPSTWEVEAGGLQVQGLPELLREILPPKKWGQEA
jgi:hypothetical protein